MHIIQSNREEFKVGLRDMVQMSSASANPLVAPYNIVIENEQSCVIAAAECGISIPERIDLHFGETLRVWNLHVIRNGDVQHYLKSAFLALINYALENKYDSIVIEILKDAKPAANQSGFIVREASEPDTFYATKRLF